MDEKWREGLIGGELKRNPGEGVRRGRRANAEKEVLINNSRWWRIRKRVKSIGVMTRGKAEAKYFPSR